MANVGISVTLPLEEVKKIEELADEANISRSKMIARLIRIGIGIVNVKKEKGGKR